MLAYGQYALDQLTPDAEPATRLDRVLAGRAREEHWDPTVFGTDLDGEGRVLVATRTGVRAEPRMLLDRWSPGLTERESFSVPELDAQVGASGLGELGVPDGIRGIHAGADGAVYYWTAALQLGRIDLP